MKKRWHEALLIIGIAVCVGAALALYLKDIFWDDVLPSQVSAEVESGENIEASGASADAQADKSENSTSAEADLAFQDNDEETSDTGEEIGYNGDTFEDNGQPYCIKVNRQMNVVTIYTLDEDGYYTVPYKAMVCSVGLNDKTPTGTYEMPSDRYEWRELVGGVYGQYAVRIKKSIMFHSVPYYRPQVNQLESEEYNKLGEAASKGCIRLSVADAKWIYDNCQKGTIVQIFDSDYIGPLGKPESIKLDLEDEKSCYDPTDDVEGNPWFEQESTEVKLNDVRSSMSSTEEPEDTEPPKITLKVDAPEALTELQAQDVAYLESLIEVTDESEIAEINVSLPLWVSRKIAYRVVYTAVDVYGNAATAYYSFEIKE